MCVLCLIVAGSAQPVQAQSQPDLFVVGPTAGQGFFTLNPNQLVQAQSQPNLFVVGPTAGLDFFTFNPNTLFTPGQSSIFDDAIAKMQRELFGGPPFSGNPPAALPLRTQEIKAILDAAGTTGGAEAKARIAELLAKSPDQAQAYTATLIEISDSGIPPNYPANASLTSSMAEALATQVAAWQAEGSGSLVAVTALAAVNEALAAAGVGTGSGFAIAFAAKLDQLGRALATLTSPDSPLTVLIYFTPKNETALISPN